MPPITPLKEKKTKRPVPTVRQRKTARLLADAIQNGNEYKTAKEIMVDAGYGTGLQNQPARVLESVGTITALEELGFTEENAKNVVTHILKDETAKAGDRLKAADMVFKVHGTYAAEKSINVNVEATVNTEKLMELASMMRRNV